MDAKPCPFCGQSVITVVDGDTFRWRHVECGACGAMGPEIRCQTLGDGTPAEWERKAEADAIEAWNERAYEMGSAAATGTPPVPAPPPA